MMVQHFPMRSLGSDLMLEEDSNSSSLLSNMFGKGVEFDAFFVRDLEDM